MLNISVVLPAYNDAKSLPILINKCIKLLPNIARKYEIIVVDDGSEDDTQQVLTGLRGKAPFLHIITHKKNRGYGGALISGFQKAKYDFVFYTDSDGQYDIMELKKMVAWMDDKTDVVTGFKVKRSDAWHRRIIGVLWNQSMKLFFGLKVRDVDCDFRLIRRVVLVGLGLRVKSGAFDVELIKKLQEKNARIKEIPVHHYPRIHGNSQFFNPIRIINSVFDVLKFITAPGYGKKNSF